VFAWTDTATPKPIPLNADPAHPDRPMDYPDGTLTPTQGGKVRVVAKGQAPMFGADGHTPALWRSHFADCPLADQFRRRPGGRR
jgi:hypothetical protein